MQMNLKQPIIDESAIQLLLSHQWSGNIRELQSVLFRAVALNERGDISSKDISVALAQFKQKEVTNSVGLTVESEVGNWASAQAKFEEQLIRALYPYYPTTRKLAERLEVLHNKIAMKLRQFCIRN
ncbi:MAG: transcriptional regulator of aroF, aroG, tyrA and aromatic amino acid transport [Psychroserpens sp.]|jgi:transcriptional regulator of aroF, aroG, tyrA and aromatic amino acid transport